MTLSSARCGIIAIGWRYAVVIFYGFETLKLNTMNTKRIEEIQKDTAYPDSISVQQALLKVWNECEQEKAVKNNAVLPHVSISVCSRCGAKTVSHPSNLCYGCWMLSDS